MLDLILAATLYVSAPASVPAPAPAVPTFCIPLTDGTCVMVPDANVPDWARGVDLSDPYATSPGVPRPSHPYTQPGTRYEDGTTR